MNIQKLVFISLLFGSAISSMQAAMSTVASKDTDSKASKQDDKFAAMASKALFFAVKAESPNDVDQILELGANPNAQDEEGKTPLHYAAAGSADCMEIVSSLLNHKADPQIKDNDGHIPADLWQNGGILHIFMDQCGYKIPQTTPETKDCHICRGLYGSQGAFIKTPACGHECHEKCYNMFKASQDESGKFCPICYMNALDRKEKEAASSTQSEQQAAEEKKS